MHDGRIGLGVTARIVHNDHARDTKATKISRQIKRGDAGLAVSPAGLDEDSSRDAVAMPDTILAKVESERSIRRSRHWLPARKDAISACDGSRTDATFPDITNGKTRWTRAIHAPAWRGLEVGARYLLSLF